jgi:hypothetical protein
LHLRNPKLRASSGRLSVSHAIRHLVRRGEETYDAVDQVPEQLRIRQLAARSFDRNGMMVGWELVDGQKLESAIERLFADPKAAYVHVHYAAPGCYAARIDRV